jgi:chromate transporter
MPGSSPGKVVYDVMANSGRGVSDAASKSDRPAVEVSLLALFLAFLRLGCTAFGGGTAGWIYREMVQRRGWLDEQLFLADLALTQPMPGSNGINMAVLMGRRLKGGVGALVAPFGLLAGPFLMILVIGTVYGRIAGHHSVHAVLDGVAAAVVGLNLATGISAITRGGTEPSGIAIAGVVVLCVGLLGWPMLPVLLVLSPISIGLALVRGPRA